MQLIRLPDELRFAILALSSPVPGQQSKGAVVIMKHVETELQGFSGQGLPDNVKKIIQALVCRLTSNKKEGIYTGLHTILKHKSQTVEFTYKTLQKEFENKVSRDDELYDVLVSEILGYTALVRSGHLGKHPKLLQNTVERLVGIREGGEAINIMATTLVLDILERYHESSAYELVLERLQNIANVPMKKIRPCLLWIRLVLMKKCSNMPKWLSSTLDANNYSALGEVLKTCKAVLPKVHPLLEELASALARGSTDTKFPLGEFWRTNFYSRLHSFTSEDLRLALTFLKILIPKLKRKSEIPIILGEKVITFLLKNACTNKDLKTALPDLVSVIEQLVQDHQVKEEEVQLAVVEALILPPGTIQFDSLTKTNLVQRITKHLTASDVKKLSVYITKQIVGKDPRQVMFAEALANLLTNPKVRDDATWRTEQLQTLIRAMFQSQTSKTGYLRNVLMQVLFQETQRATDIVAFLKPLVDFTYKELETCKEDNGVIKSENKKLWDDIKKKMALLESKKVKWPENSNQCLKVLYYAMTFYILQDFKGANDLIPKLDECYSVVQKQGSKKNVDVDESSWVEMATELMLNFAPSDNTFFRAAAQSAFRLIVNEQTSDTISMLIEAVVPEGMKDAEDEELGEEEEEEEVVETEEIIKDDAEEKDEDEDEDDDEEDDVEVPLDEKDSDIEEDLDEENDEGKVSVAKLRAELALVQENFEDIELDEAPEEELEILDKAMSAIFAKYHAAKKGKKVSKKEKLNSIYLECRAYDLLEVYIEEHPSMGLTVGLIRPLLAALNSLATTSEKGDKKNDTKILRLRKLLDILGGIESFKKIDMNILEVSEELESFVTYTFEYKDLLSRHIANCHTLMVKCSLQILGEAVHQSNPIMDLFSEHLLFLLNRKESEKKILIYAGACSLDWASLWKLLKDLVDFAFEKNNKYYAKTNALSVLSLLFKNKALFSRVSPIEVKQIGETVSQHLLGIITRFTVAQQVHFVSNLFDFMVVLRENHRTPETSGIRWDEILAAVTNLDKEIPTESRSSLRVVYKEMYKALHRDPNQQCGDSESRKRKLEDEEERKARNKRRKELSRKKKQKKAKAQASRQSTKKFLGRHGKVKRKRTSQKKRAKRQTD
ncbi:uncharacterized protein LOC122265895 [Penaeus japonicus]|uniref:uncharacterized protein LOC122265895 n=1 Tax=Penaeus japonicus TaxID=27405 RepID=UPI001C70F52A|nr:uncharacterized protein LOC122265895 [Penaeus japonicus]